MMNETQISNPYPKTEELTKEFEEKFNAACSASTHVLHDRYEDYNDTIDRVGLTRIENDPDVYIAIRKYHGFNQTLIAKISQYEIDDVVKFLNNYELPTNPQTIEEELKLLRKMAGFMIDMSRYLNAGMPNNTPSKYNPCRSIPMGLHYLAKEYRDRFGIP